MPDQIPSHTSSLLPLNPRSTAVITAPGLPLSVRNANIPPPQRMAAPPLLAHHAPLNAPPAAAASATTGRFFERMPNLSRDERLYFPLRLPPSVASRETIIPAIAPRLTPPPAAELDITSSRVLSDAQKLFSCTPQLAERIFQKAMQLHKHSLQRLIGQSAYSESDITAIRQALKHLLAEKDPARAKRMEEKVFSDPALSTADKNILIFRIRATHSSLTIYSHNKLASEVQPYIFNPADLSSGLNHDLIEILLKFSVTQEQLNHYLRITIAAERIITENLLGITSIIFSSDRNTLRIKNIIEIFGSHLDRIKHYLATEISFPACRILDSLFINRWAPFSHDEAQFRTALEHLRNRAANENLPEDLLRSRTVKILQINFLRRSALFDLFCRVCQQNPLGFSRSVLNQEQLTFLTQHHDLHKLCRSLTPSFGLRANFLFYSMSIAPFVFGDSTQPADLNLEGVPYGYRGLSFIAINKLINNLKNSELRLKLIGLYSNLRLVEITTTGALNIVWMASLADATLERLFTCRNYLVPPKENDMDCFVLIKALKEIGKIIIGPHYDHSSLPELLAWVRKRIKYQASDNDLAYLLFEKTRRTEKSIPRIAADLEIAQNPDSNSPYSARYAVQDFTDFIHRVITRETLDKIQLPEQVRLRFNTLVTREKILSFIAERFFIPVIQEDALEDFQRFYDTSGGIHSRPPDEVTMSIILRPGSLTPLAADGRQQATINLEYHDNHTLLRELVGYLTRQEKSLLNEKQLSQLIFDIEHELSASAAP